MFCAAKTMPAKAISSLIFHDEIFCQKYYRNCPQTGLKLSGDRDITMLEMSGENFTPGLKVWFSDIETDTMYR